MCRKHLLCVVIVFTIVTSMLAMINVQPVTRVTESRFTFINSSLPSNRTAPITITSDADYPLYASSGSGTAGNPWVLEDYMIECNGTGGGITITGCTDHAVIRDSYVNETDAASAGVGIVSSANVIIDNVTAEAGVIGIALVSSYDITINNSFVYSEALAGIYTDGSWDITLQNTVIEMRGANGAPVYLGTLNTGNGSTRVNVIDSTLVGNQTSYLFYSYASNDVTMQNTTIHNGTRCYFYSTENVNINACNITSEQSVFYFQVTCTNVSVSDSVLDAGTNGIFTFSSATGNNVNITGSTVTGGLDPVGDNVNIVDCDIDGIYIDGDNGVIANNTIHDSTVDGIGGTANGWVISGNTIWNHTDCGMELTGVNNMITNNTIWDVGSGIKLTGGGHVIEGNDIRHLYDNDACHVESGTGLVFRYNYCYGPSNASTSTISTGIALMSVTDALIEWNTFDSFNGTGDGYGVALTDAGCTNATIQHNNFTGCWFGIVTGAVANPIRENWFKDTFNAFEEMNGVNSTVYENNYYFEYFDTHPNDITINVSTTVLESPFLCSHSRSHVGDPPQTRYDLAPLYHEAWYPRPETINVRFYSIVNYEGILMDHLRVYIDGLQIASNAFVPGHVLFAMIVYDYEGRPLHDQMYNINATGVHMNIGLETTAQVFFKFWSSLDGFGLDFGLCKLFVDGIRITTSSPIMRPRVINVTVTDGYDCVIYEQTLNLSITGIYVDLFLPIAPLTVVNKFNRSVIVHVMRAGTSKTFVMGPSASIAGLRYAIGIYTCVIQELDGTDLVITTHEIKAAYPATWVIEFGWINATVEPIGFYVPTPMDYIIAFIAFGIGLGVPVIAIVMIRARPRARRVGTGMRTRTVIRS